MPGFCATFERDQPSRQGRHARRDARGRFAVCREDPAHKARCLEAWRLHWRIYQAIEVDGDRVTAQRLLMELAILTGAAHGQ